MSNIDKDFLIKKINTLAENWVTEAAKFNRPDLNNRYNIRTHYLGAACGAYDIIKLIKEIDSNDNN